MSQLPLIFAKELDGKGGALSYTDISTLTVSVGQYWLHFDANHSDTVHLFKKSFPDIDEHSLTAIFDEDARPRSLVLEAGVLIILRGINHNEGDAPEDMTAVRLWVTKNRIISLRYRKSKAVLQVANNLDQGRGPLTIGDIVTSLASMLFNHIEISIDKLDEKVDDLESRVLDEPDKPLRRKISEARKTAILLRRYITPQREAINQLRYEELEWLSLKNQRRIHESNDVLLRSIESLDAIRERTQVVKDELDNTLSDKLNRNLYVLSVITAIFLPLSFLTGLFGINIGGLPGVNNASAFFIFTVSLAVIVAIQIVLFKCFKWF